MLRVLVCCSLLLTGCGTMIELATLQHRFASQFDCHSAQVSSSAAGYRVEGCGQVAEYACFDTDPSSEDPIRNAKPGGGRLLGAMIGSMLLDSMEVDTCVLAHVARADVTRAVWSEPAVVGDGKQTTAVKTRLVFSGGSLLAYAKPKQHPAHALLHLRSTRRLASDPCTAQLFHDGIAVPIERVERVDPYEVRMLLRVEHLQRVATSVRFAGDVCGTSFELDDYGRTALATFAARAHEAAVSRERERYAGNARSVGRPAKPTMDRAHERSD